MTQSIDYYIINAKMTISSDKLPVTTCNLTKEYYNKQKAICNCI